MWSLPRTCHTSILHLVSGLHSITNVVLFRSSNLLYAALHSKSSLLADVFSDSCSLIYTSIGYNYVYGYRHRKIYNECDLACANFIRDVRLYPTLNSYLEDEIICVHRRLFSYGLCTFDFVFLFIFAPLVVCLINNNNNQ